MGRTRTGNVVWANFTLRPQRVSPSHFTSEITAELDGLVTDNIAKAATGAEAVFRLRALRELSLLDTEMLLALLSAAAPDAEKLPGQR